jgi:transcriptional regulator with XRE-family HTH domain
MEQEGINPAGLADKLGVTREAVSKWLHGEALPRPDKLLRLGKLLKLTFSELVIRDEPNAPVVAFRRMKGTKTKDHHIEHAQTMGRMLRHLVPYLPFDRLATPPVLKEPSNKYEYLQRVAAMVRQEIHVAPDDSVDFTHLIRHFNKLQAVLIPVLWGNKQRHENATHIYLPDSQTTWVYLNLDVNIHDFKFWMAHELGHCLSPQLRGNEAEDFADAFAGTLLFPRVLAEKGYALVSRHKSKEKQLSAICDLAEQHVIAPYTIYLEINRHAEQVGARMLDLAPNIHPWATQFNKQYLNLSATLFGGETYPEPRAYLDTAANLFETPFFEILRHYLREHHKGPGMLQTLMDIPLLDARGLHAELT